VRIVSSAPTRIDLAGGTIDIWPLYLFHDGATTVNVAISLRAHAQLESRTDGRVEIRSIDTDRIVIAEIVPGSPAARAGLVAGDEVLTIEGTQVAGAKALALRSLAQRDVGQTLHATLRHHGGAVYSVSMVAVPRPK